MARYCSLTARSSRSAARDLAIPAGYTRIDGTGKFVTPGIIDIHSHLGDYPTPSVEAHSDGNEATNPTTPEVWAEHSVWPQDPGFTRALANGGMTALQILPGSANLMGGRSVTLEERAQPHGAGHEISRRALRHEDGLRREPQARLWRQGADALDPDGQLGGQPPDLARRQE